MHIKKYLFMVLLLSSCASMLNPGKNINKQFVIKDEKIDLQEQICKPIKPYKALMVVNEDALAPYNSNAIYYVNSSNQINKFAINEWVTEPAIMISNNLQLRLNQSCLYSAVVPDKSFVPVSSKLSFQLIKFQADFTDHKHPVLVLEARVQLLNLNNNVEKWKSFHLEQPLKASNVTDAIQASNTLVQQFDDQVVNMLS